MQPHVDRFKRVATVRRDVLKREEDVFVAVRFAAIVLLVRMDRRRAPKDALYLLAVVTVRAVVNLVRPREDIVAYLDLDVLGLPLVREPIFRLGCYLGLKFL